MIKEIRYSGYSAVPSDYECKDGQLALSMNLLVEDGQIKPLGRPKAVNIGLSPSQKATYIHETSSYRHYILIEGDTVMWIEAGIEIPDEENTEEENTEEENTEEGNTEEGNTEEGNTEGETEPGGEDAVEEDGSVAPVMLKSFPDAEIHQVSSIGNTLIILTSEGMYYFLWKGGETGYLELGSQIPECSLSFGLQCEMKRSDEFEIAIDIAEEDIYSEFSDEQKSSVTNKVLAKVNKFIADESTSKGKFIFPFMVRYAYRLYDGSLTMHSAPVLMICSSDLAPRVFWFNIHGSGGTYTSATLRVVSPVHSLDYACKSALPPLANWSDIVKSVDIFISKPIYTYDQNGECTKFVNGGTDLSGFSVCRHVNQEADTSTYPLRYQKNDFGKLYAFTFTPEDLLSRPGGVLETPRRSVDAVKEDIRGCSQFYFLYSIRTEDLQADRTVIPVKEDYLQSLVAREVMTDDYDSHDRLISSQAFAYNSRLNVSGIRKVLFQGFDGNSLFNYSDGYVYNWTDVSPTYIDSVKSVTVAVFIKQDGKDIVVYGSAGTCGNRAPLLFFYYPNPNAYKAVIIRNNVVDDPLLTVPLEQHGFLNGAFYFNGWEEPAGVTQARPIASSVEERTVDVPNKVYTSEINNPFFFPVLGINTVGTGRILGISTAAKALSQGQFGQFPLYAFTTEGIWALEVSGTGSYSARQPITRDVCTNPESITQMDSAVLFVTDRGIMLISGSSTQCISDVINTESPFDAMELPAMPRLLEMFGHGEDNCLPSAPFRQFLSGCGMLYDYVHQRVIVYNKNFTYAYVYSLKSKEWGMMYSTIEDGINSYPEALATDHDGKLLDFSSNGNIIQEKGLLVTRPLKLDAPDVLKTVDTVIQRGKFRKGHVQCVLYGSRDLFHWHAVWSSKDHYLRGFRGTPYKYFRLACLTDFAEDESLFGASVQFTPRLTDQLR